MAEEKKEATVEEVSEIKKDGKSVLAVPSE